MAPTSGEPGDRPEHDYRHRRYDMNDKNDLHERLALGNVLPGREIFLKSVVQPPLEETILVSDVHGHESQPDEDLTHLHRQKTR